MQFMTSCRFTFLNVIVLSVFCCSPVSGSAPSTSSTAKNETVKVKVDLDLDLDLDLVTESPENSGFPTFDMSTCVVRIGAGKKDLIHLKTLGRPDGMVQIPRYNTTYMDEMDEECTYVYDPCFSFEFGGYLSDDKSFGDGCPRVSLCKHYVHDNKKMYFTLGENRQGRVRVGTEHREGEQPRVYLLYTGTGSARLIETRVELVCDPEREGLTDGLFTVVARKDRGKLGIYNYAELHHKCCCPGSFCGDTGPVGADSEIMLVLVGTMLSLLLMVAIIGGLCYVKRTHLQIYSKLPGVNPGGGAIINNGVVWNVERGNAGLPGALMGASEGGKSSNFRDYEPAAVASARRKMIPVLPDALIKSESVDMGQRLGGGVFADTHIARWNEMSVAVKRLTLSIHSNQLTSEAMELMKEEVWFLSRQRHKNIVCVLGLSLDGRLPFLLTEYIIGECLKDYLGVNGQHLTWPQRIRMCSQVADGMAFLHSTKPPIIHRDLRCGNLFLSDNDLVKVADFSLAKLLQPIRNQCEEDDCSCQRLKSGCPATIRWTAPELLAHPQAREGEGTVISTAIDVYSFAMIMWETVFYKDPFDEISTEEEVIEIVKNGGRPEVASTADMMPQFKDLMKVCWDQRPSVRPPFKQLAVNLKEMVGAARAHQKSQSNKQRQHKPQHGAEKV